MEDITDYAHVKIICKDFEKIFGKYHNLYPESDTLLEADIFKNFRKICSKIYNLDLLKYLSASGLAW